MDMKFKVVGPKHSEAIQEELFDLGYSWIAGKVVSYASENYLYTEDTYMLHGDSDENFISSKSRETTLHGLKGLPADIRLASRSLGQDNSYGGV